MRRVALVRDPVVVRPLLEARGAILQPLVDPELVRSFGWFGGTGAAEVDVEPTVGVHVGECHPRGPRARRVPDAGRARDVAESELTEIQEDACALLIRREDDFWERVAGEVADGDAAAVVIIAVREDVLVPRL